MLSAKQGRKINTYVPDYVVYDLETTGTNPQTDEVVEIAGIKVQDGKVVEEFSTLVNPGIPIPDEASSVNEIYDDMVADSPDFEAALKDFMDFAGDRVLVGHNIHRFDMHFIWRDAQKFWGRTIGNNYIDTLHIAQMYLPQLRSHSLVKLAWHYGVYSGEAHRALADCRMNQQVFECLREEMEHPAAEVKICPRCGGFLKKRNGRFGEFWGCEGYPECRYTENAR